MKTIPTILLTPVLLAGAAMLAGCAGSRVGHCVGAAPGMLGPGEKVLLNTDAHGLVIQGYDPVAYFTLKRPVMGSPAHRSQHAGGTYQFASAEHKAMFDAAPERYAPRFGGYCAYAASIDKVSPIDPAFWEIVDGRLILQHNQRAWDLWQKDPAGNLVKADRNWPGIVARAGAPPRQLLNVDDQGVALAGYDPVAYFTVGRPTPGDPDLARQYQGATYRFASKENKDLFEADPAKYVPAFGGFCGYAASINKVSPVDPNYWQLVDGRLVLQHTPKAFELFNKDVPTNYAKANRNWPGLSARRCRG